MGNLLFPDNKRGDQSILKKRMKFNLRILILLLMIILTRVGNSQPWYFNNLYNPNNTWSAGLSITSHPSGYMACAISGDIYNYYQICIQELSHEGTILNYKNYGQSGMDYYPGEDGSFKKDEQGRYFLFGSIDFFNYVVKGLFIYFDSDGDTIFSKKYESLYTTRLAGRNCGKTSDNGFILTGDENTTDSSGVDCYLIKIDSTGTEQWRKHYGMNIGDVPYSIIQTPDLGYAVGGLTFSGAQITYDPIIIKTDSLGELEWMLNPGGEYKDDKAMVCNTSDSCIMVLTAFADSMWSSEYAYTRINLIKIDLEGNIIWNKKFGPSKPVNFISNIISLEDGDFMACGYTKYPGYIYRAGWLFRFNANGDSLWYRDYHYFMDNPSFGNNYLYDVSITEDKGFIATGQAFTFDPPNQVQKMWVLKVDSVGCEIPDCWVGVEEDGKTIGREDGKKGELEIWPNPASGVLSVKCLGLSSGISYSISIYDLFGREIRTITIPVNEYVIQFDVGNLVPGLYLVILKDESKIIGSAKMVVSR